MSWIQGELRPEAIPTLAALERELGFVPNLFRAQGLLPRLIEVEAGIAGAVLFREGALSRVFKESLLLHLAATCGNRYCTTAHWHVLQGLGVAPERLERIAVDPRQAEMAPGESALLDFALLLACRPSAVQRSHVEALGAIGLADEAILEAVLITSLTRFLCTLAVGLGVEPDFHEAGALRALELASGRRPGNGGEGWPELHDDHRPYLRSPERDPAEFPPFAFFQRSFGFVPNIFRAQTLLPHVIEAEARTVETILLTGDVLPRVAKEYILLVVSAANFNSYCVAVHCEMLRRLDVAPELADQVALDHHAAQIPPDLVRLLDFALKLSRRPREVGPGDLEALRGVGYSEPQIVEAVVMTALTEFLNTLQMGLSPAVDFTPRLAFGLPPAGAAANPAEAAGHPTSGCLTAPPDADADCVARAQAGDATALAELVRRYSLRVYRTMVAITGSPTDAEDDTQNALLRVCQRLGEFRGESRFATWLTRIAINEGLQRLRRDRRAEMLPLEPEEASDAIAPRRVMAWADDPEKRYEREELRGLVERALLELPPKYRLPIVLRDLEGLSGEEAAAALGLKLPTLKTQLLRGRLLLREALSPHFTRRGGGGA